jgi:hypothetical protein
MSNLDRREATNPDRVAGKRSLLPSTPFAAALHLLRPRNQSGASPAGAFHAALLLVAGALFLSGCQTRIFIYGTPPERVTILNGTFWRSAGGEGASNVSNRVTGGGELKAAFQ